MPNIMDYFNITNNGSGDLTNLVKSPPNYCTSREIENIKSSLEDIAAGSEITITFKPDIHNRYKSITLTRMVFDLLTSFSNRIKDNFYIDIILVGEFSKSGMFHMHGIIKCNNERIINSLRRKLTKDIGRHEIRMIHNTSKYIDYILKDIPKRQILQEEVIRFHHINTNTKNMPKSYNTQ